MPSKVYLRPLEGCGGGVYFYPWAVSTRSDSGRKVNITVIPVGDTFVAPPCPKVPHTHAAWVPLYLSFLGREEQRLQNLMISRMPAWEKPWLVTRLVKEVP